MEREREDIEFEQALADKQYNEIKTVLKEITTLLSEGNNSGIKNMMLTQTNKLERFVQVLQDTNSSVFKKDSEKFITLVDDIITSNEKVVSTLENRMLPDTFDLIKNGSGVTVSVKVNYKPANRIVNGR